MIKKKKKIPPCIILYAKTCMLKARKMEGGGGSRNYIHSFLFTYIVTATTTVGHIIEKIHAMKAQDYVNLAFHTKTTQFHLILTWSVNQKGQSELHNNANRVGYHCGSWSTGRESGIYGSTGVISQRHIGITLYIVCPPVALCFCWRHMHSVEHSSLLLCPSILSAESRLQCILGLEIS